MNIPLIALLFFVVGVVMLAFPVKGVAAEVAKAWLWTGMFVIMISNLSVHVIHL